jgi:ubiquitin-like protein Pup
MAEQERRHKRGEPAGDAEQGGAAASEKGKKLKEDMDRLVDEIDDVLEENAEEFVKSYVQRGGE